MSCQFDSLTWFIIIIVLSSSNHHWAERQFHYSSSTKKWSKLQTQGDLRRSHGPGENLNLSEEIKFKQFIIITSIFPWRHCHFTMSSRLISSGRWISSSQFYCPLDGQWVEFKCDVNCLISWPRRQVAWRHSSWHVLPTQVTFITKERQNQETERWATCSFHTQPRMDRSRVSCSATSRATTTPPVT